MIIKIGHQQFQLIILFVDMMPDHHDKGRQVPRHAYRLLCYDCEFKTHQDFSFQYVTEEASQHLHKRRWWQR